MDTCTSDQCEEVCWICFEGPSPDRELARVCACPRVCHQKCLSRWQLHQAGRHEEKQCRFCEQELSDWRPHMSTGCKATTPYMRVSFNGKTHKVMVTPGEEGAREFEQKIREMLQLPSDQDFDVIFHCRAPGTGDKLQLQGLCAFDAAVHCASMTSWPTASQQNGAASKQQGRGSWLRQLCSRLCSRLDLAAGTAVRSA